MPILSFPQRQAERIKRDKAQRRRGDDAAPQTEPDTLVAVSRFEGSRLASGPTPSPYQHESSGRKRKWISDSSMPSNGAHKFARTSSAATVGAAIVEAEYDLETEVGFCLSWSVLTYSDSFFRCISVQI